MGKLNAYQVTSCLFLSFFVCLFGRLVDLGRDIISLYRSGWLEISKVDKPMYDSRALLPPALNCWGYRCMSPFWTPFFIYSHTLAFYVTNRL